MYISIHALRVEGDCTVTEERNGAFISIHALRVEGDQKLFFARALFFISIHALRVEGDQLHGHRGAQRRFHFYPRPPGGGRL